MQNPREGRYPGVMMWTLVNSELCLQTSPIPSFSNNINVQDPYDHYLTLRTQKVRAHLSLLLALTLGNIL